MNPKVIITAALAGAASFKDNNPAVPYTPAEFAEEAYKAHQAGAAMVHVHARRDDGFPTHEIDRIRATYDAIRAASPDLIVNLSSAVGHGATPEQRIGQIKAVKPEVECYDMGGLDNFLLIARQGFFSEPVNINFVWGVAGGQRFRPDAFLAMYHALPPNANFTTCGVGKDQFPCNMQSCLMGGHMRVGLEDNVRMPNGELAKGSYEQVEWAVKVAAAMGRDPATPAEARDIMGLHADNVNRPHHS